jgi:hypothetical protein
MTEAWCNANTRHADRIRSQPLPSARAGDAPRNR